MGKNTSGGGSNADGGGTSVVVEEDRWQAVVARDATRDGDFVFAVASTGVYCRPSCPSRRPRRERVRFYASPVAAEVAGFRACRRCRPDASPAPRPALTLVRRACALIEADPADDLKLERLARTLEVSPHHLQRTFRRMAGVSPREYAEAVRLGALRRELRRGSDVTTAVYEAGFGSSSRVYERAAAHLGMTPAAFGRGGAGAEIRYASVGTPLGRLLVAATERGICFVSLGDSEANVEAALRAEFPAAASVEKSPQTMRPLIEPVVAHLRGALPHMELPIEVRATAFQRAVWQELSRIPRGATRTYTEIARAIGHPRAVRAVANACAANPVAVVVPCHRVVRGDGERGGYRWGEERKAALLEAEARA
jgi:AraC family transcriptional regulator, regulatory protein of adaptative response / methylated-DNA-[protein]-cysteine methyltransferase